MLEISNLTGLEKVYVIRDTSKSDLIRGGICY